ncbi:CaiB/BaiF CoA-transferase family protein [Amycolatopsis jiangsuensis]|uniref:Crotonobetainyl-CoA:carnitine CoA-transferase CaiB-like acyl-CoA transferase n=1 Tax=Amycolatopsis jiangsuensis TaxID=1181879 RepID=A0A840IPN5_9PSEU|nr:CoA transferase [Amycolatopsis jiangsuensis]MBB4683890.1 crotonobetainyl-CoA:carnitine CoA-transferase CaiB-like acyl-CoA transferase [Amycolatopsis jiangsuensis]
MPDQSVPLRVLDLTDELAYQGARLLVGLGADVVRVAKPEDRGPADALHWHAGKRLVRADPDELAPSADIVLESGPVHRLRGVREDGSSRWPDAVHVVVTPFGLTGPRRHWTGDDLVLASAGGMTWLGGMPAGQPKPPPREQAVQLAGAHAALGALLGVHSGTGQLVDISVQEAVAATLETGAIAWVHGGHHPMRNGGVYEHVAHRIFTASDGYVAGGYSGSDRMWTDLLAWLAEEGEAGDLTGERWSDAVTRWRDRPHVDEIVQRFVGRRTAREVAEQGRARALPWAEVVEPAQLPDNPQLRARDFFLRVGEARDVGFPWRTPESLEPLAEAGSWRTPARRPRRGTAPGGALSGVRVLDLTWVLAGPYVTKTLGEHGADIIKIESRHRQDPTRFAPSMRLRPGAGPDDAGYFLNFNRNKRSVALNLRTEQGRELVRALVPHCDVVVENFSPGVLARWGMDYDSLTALNPGVILVSMAGAGQTGPWRDAVTFADTLAAMSGLSGETRDPGGPPQGLTFGLGDMVAANAAVLATLELLLGEEGGHVDLSQLEAMAATMGPALLEAQLGAPGDGRKAGYPNRSAWAVPHGVYPAAGPDRWVAIAALDEGQWQALRDLANLPDPVDRRTHEDEIDEALGAWTRDQRAEDLARRLQDAGVAAAVVATGEDLVDRDEHLAARGFYPVLEHPLAGPVKHEGIVARLSRTPGALTAAAPLLGEHTAEVLGELVGLDEERLVRLKAEGVTE